jgi:hypothetical protein
MVENWVVVGAGAGRDWKNISLLCNYESLHSRSQPA